VHEVERHERVLTALAERLEDADSALAAGRSMRRDAAVALTMGLDARRA
jgi:hypothetical protein